MRSISAEWHRRSARGRKLLDRVGIGRDPAFNLLPGHRRGDRESLARARRVGADCRRAAPVSQIVDEEMARALLCGG
jgi:hypothetical protein